MDSSTLDAQTNGSEATETDELSEAGANVEAAKARIADLTTRARNGEKVTAKMVADAKDELALMEVILEGAEGRALDGIETRRLERVAALSGDLAALAADTTVAEAEAKMRAAMLDYVSAVHVFDERLTAADSVVSDPRLAPLPDSISPSHLGGARIDFNGIELRRVKFQTAISRAAGAAIREFYPRALVRLDTPSE